MNTILTRLSAELIEKYEAEGFWQGDTIYALVRGHAERTPQAFAVRDRFRRLTYRELLAAADALAADLAAPRRARRASASASGCRAGSRAWWRCSPARRAARSAARRCTATTPSARWSS